MISRKIAVVTGSRAEYGVLQPVLSRIRAEPRLRLQLIVTGAHLNPAFGKTVREIERDGCPIAARLPLHVGKGKATNVASEMIRALSSLTRAYAKLKPDLVLLLGDRYEMLCAATAALPFRIPIAHIHGGESTEGSWDDSVRHALTKMSHLHFPAQPVYARRIRQMGENPARIFCYGSPVVDRIRSLPVMSRSELADFLGIRLEKPIGVVTFHPETLKADYGLGDLEAVLSVLGARRGTWIFTYANADTGGLEINRRIERFVRGYTRGQARVFANLGQPRYFSLLRCADVMIGNSSSGILDAPYFGLPVVNIGGRQGGRFRLGLTIDVPVAEPKAIEAALRRALSMRRRLPRELSKNGISPSRNIVNVLKTTALDSNLLQKKFFDL